MVRNRAIIVYETPEKKNLAEFVVKNSESVAYMATEKKKHAKSVARNRAIIVYETPEKKKV